jgi:hypothetical protein
MKPSLLKELTLYRYRYHIGYAIFVAFLFGLLLTDISSVPYGISQDEMASSVASNSLNPFAARASDVINLPYHLLQKASIGLFGLSPLSIRLPSLIIAFIAAIVLALTLSLWFRKGTAMLALLLATASVPFISMARSGTAGVLYMLLLVLILLSAVRLTTKSRGTFFWKLVVAASGLLLFYMPLGIYAVIALLVAGIFHPHVRYQIKRTSWWQFAALFFVAGILLAPLVIAGVHDKGTVEVLFGLDALQDKMSVANISDSIITIVKALFFFTTSHINGMIAPFFNLTFTLLIMFGLVRTILDRHAARSYLLLIWLVVSLPLLILNPSQFALLFVPCIILMAVGLESFTREWYRLFPRNPYARIAALVPLTLIVIGLITIESSRYFYGYAYADTRSTHHPELMALRDTLKPHVRTAIVVPEEHLAFYDILRSKYPSLTVISPQGLSSQDAPEHIILASTKQTLPKTPTKIVCSPYENDSVLLRVYGPH